ncbi:MAG: phytase [Sphingomonadales bacterium]|nr:MAG: phytase [Sphingomonadales bacterium]
MLKFGCSFAALAAAMLAAPAIAQVTPPIAATVETAPTQGPGVDSPVLYRGNIFGAAEGGGIEVYDATGKRRAIVPAGDIRALDLRDGAAPSGAALLAALDRKTNAAKLFAVSDSGALTALSFTAPAPGMTVAGLCLARSHRDSSLYLFLVGDEGGIAQYTLSSDASGTFTARLARSFSQASETGYCVADDRGSVYISQETVGVWRFAVEPEAEIVPTLVDTVRLGHIAEEAKGVAIAPDGRLIVSDASANRLNLYDPEANYAYLGSVTVAAGATDPVTDPGGLGIGGGILAIADDDNAPDAVNLKLVEWDAVLTSAKLQQRAAPAAPARIATVQATVETKPVETGGDAADDPAIWIHPTDPSQSVIIATQKQSGLYVYDMAGKPLQFLPDGRMNNVDLRNGFTLGGRQVTLVTASDRTHKSIAIYALDPGTRRLTNVADGVQPTGLDDPYGLCMYRSGKTRKTYVFINQTDGKMRQWELTATPAGKVRAKLVRDLPFASQVEGCVADDDTGMLYVAEEDVGLWREGAEPTGGPSRVSFAKVADNPALKDDMEGVGLVRLPRGRGYLVVSSQGNDSYAVFRRDGNNAYVGSFAIGANAALGIDGVSETDGLDVTSMSAGPGFEGGLMVAQDGRNVSPPENQNFKLIPWAAIAEALKLER